jgi:hypothetical protein
VWRTAIFGKLGDWEVPAGESGVGSPEGAAGEGVGGEEEEGGVVVAGVGSDEGETGGGGEKAEGGVIRAGVGGGEGEVGGGEPRSGQKRGTARAVKGA